MTKNNEDKCRTCTSLVPLKSDRTISKCCLGLNPLACTQYKARPEYTKPKGDNPTPNQQAVIKELTNYISPYILAVAVVKEMVDQDAPVSFSSAQHIYLRFLDNLHDNLSDVIRSF